jgi:hypothetical protein
MKLREGRSARFKKTNSFIFNNSLGRCNIKARNFESPSGKAFTAVSGKFDTNLSLLSLFEECVILF